MKPFQQGGIAGVTSDSVRRNGLCVNSIGRGVAFMLVSSDERGMAFVSILLEKVWAVCHSQ